MRCLCSKANFSFTNSCEVITTGGIPCRSLMNPKKIKSLPEETKVIANIILFLQWLIWWLWEAQKNVNEIACSYSSATNTEMYTVCRDTIENSRFVFLRQLFNHNLGGFLDKKITSWEQKNLDLHDTDIFRNSNFNWNGNVQ